MSVDDVEELSLLEQRPREHVLTRPQFEPLGAVRARYRLDARAVLPIDDAGRKGGGSSEGLFERARDAGVLVLLLETSSMAASADAGLRGLVESTRCSTRATRGGTLLTRARRVARDVVR